MKKVHIPIGRLFVWRAFNPVKNICILILSCRISIYNYPLITEQLQGTCKNENSRHTGIIQPKCVSPSTYFVSMIINFHVSSSLNNNRQAKLLEPYLYWYIHKMTPKVLRNKLFMVQLLKLSTLSMYVQYPICLH